MAVSKAKKSEILNELKETIKNAKSIAFTSNTGLTVEDVSSLRTDLREVDSSFTLAKKTLIKIAFKEVYDVEIDDELLPNQIAMVCSNEDAVAGLGKANAFMKKVDEKMVWTGSYFEGEIKNAEDTIIIAALPSRETLLGRLVGSMQSPLSGLARFFDAASKDLEEKGQTKVGDLKGAAEVKTEEPKAEEKKEEVKEALKTEEAKVEEKVEEKAEAPKAEEKKEEAPAVEAKAEEKKEETK